VFDVALDKQIWDLQAQRIGWEVELAKKRRERPQEVENLVRDLMRQRDEDEEDEDDDMVVDEDRPAEIGLSGKPKTFSSRSPK
jgi:hypothetical protein